MTPHFQNWRTRSEFNSDFHINERVFDVYHACEDSCCKNCKNACKECSDTFPRPFVRDLLGLRYPSEDISKKISFISHSFVSNSLLDAFNLIVLIDLIVNFLAWVNFF